MGGVLDNEGGNVTPDDVVEPDIRAAWWGWTEEGGRFIICDCVFCFGCPEERD